MVDLYKRPYTLAHHQPKRLTDAKYDGTPDENFKPDGVPVFFIPGNAGSYRQVRSIASLAAEITASSRKTIPRLDFYTVDFQEDFTAFHGRTLLDQAEYVNDAIQYILKLYDKSDPDIPHPKSVIIIGHSMGGFIARSLVVLNNYLPESINTIVTLATPHTMPPLTFDSEMSRIYNQVNQYWAKSFSEESVNRNPLSSVALVSIGGGKLDNMIQSDYTLVSPLISPSNAFSTLSTTIPGVWTSIDHLAIVWCHQCRYALVRSLLDIVDPSLSSKTKPLSQRMEIFAKYLLSGFEPYQYNKQMAIKTPKRFVIKVNEDSQSLFQTSKISNHIPLKRLNLLPLDKENNDKNQMAHIIDDPESGISYLLCSKLKNTPDEDTISLDLTESIEGPRTYFYSCTEIHSEDAKSIPYSTKQNTESFESGYFPNVGLKSARYHLFNVSQELTDFDFIAALTDLQKQGKGSLININGGFNPTTVEVKSTTLSLLLKGFKIKLKPLEYIDISLKSATSGLISYKAKINSKSICEQPSSSSGFTFLIRQYVLDPFESKWHVNAGESRPVYISFHGVKSPFVPYNKHQSDNLHLQVFSPFFTENTDKCGPVTIKISVDVWGSLSNYVIRYRTLIVPFGFSITASILWLQFWLYLKTGEFISFSSGLDWIVSNLLLRIIPGIILSYVFLSFEATRNILYYLLQFPYLFITRSTPLSYLPQFTQNETLIGESQLSLLLVAPLGFIVSLGFVILVYYVIFFPISKVGKYLANIDKTDNETKNSLQKVNLYPIIVALVVVFGLSFFIFPYTLALFVGLLYILFYYGKASYYFYKTEGSALENSLRKEKDDIKAISVAFISYNMIESFSMLLFLSVIPVGVPIFIAWIHQVIENSLFSKFSSHHNILYLIPMLLSIKTVVKLTDMIAQCSPRGKKASAPSQNQNQNQSATPLPPASSPLIYPAIIILKYSAAFTFIFGFLHVYSIQNFSFLFSIYLFILVHWNRNI
ncbi:uncharacterized protein SAPINGB_P003378 [Magnusiomyces paraingens]|uniref:GPI inositol-deacylase n=1 Tax=Magnusiomyces paraingens TaxID=2606893 RepID=A0A5E8BRE2_9ASCO|nr:uncharacterized protein SAPINGB_P003378 [Saprochaete ingens]VVT53049.1 unnamed protein product [Saprochaete ingens]